MEDILNISFDNVETIAKINVPDSSEIISQEKLKIILGKLFPKKKQEKLQEIIKLFNESTKPMPINSYISEFSSIRYGKSSEDKNFNIIYENIKPKLTPGNEPQFYSNNKFGKNRFTDITKEDARLFSPKQILNNYKYSNFHIDEFNQLSYIGFYLNGAIFVPDKKNKYLPLIQNTQKFLSFIELIGNEKSKQLIDNAVSKIKSNQNNYTKFNPESLKSSELYKFSATKLLIDNLKPNEIDPIIISEYNYPILSEIFGINKHIIDLYAQKIIWQSLKKTFRIKQYQNSITNSINEWFIIKYLPKTRSEEIINQHNKEGKNIYSYLSDEETAKLNKFIEATQETINKRKQTKCQEILNFRNIATEDSQAKIFKQIYNKNKHFIKYDEETHSYNFKDKECGEIYIMCIHEYGQFISGKDIHEIVSEYGINIVSSEKIHCKYCGLGLIDSVFDESKMFDSEGNIYQSGLSQTKSVINSAYIFSIIYFIDGFIEFLPNFSVMYAYNLITDYLEKEHANLFKQIMSDEEREIKANEISLVAVCAFYAQMLINGIIKLKHFATISSKKQTIQFIIKIINSQYDIGNEYTFIKKLNEITKEFKGLVKDQVLALKRIKNVVDETPLAVKQQEKLAKLKGANTKQQKAIENILDDSFSGKEISTEEFMEIVSENNRFNKVPDFHRVRFFKNIPEPKFDETTISISTKSYCQKTQDHKHTFDTVVVDGAEFAKKEFVELHEYLQKSNGVPMEFVYNLIQTKIPFDVAIKSPTNKCSSCGYVDNGGYDKLTIPFSKNAEEIFHSQVSEEKTFPKPTNLIRDTTVPQENIAELVEIISAKAISSPEWKLKLAETKEFLINIANPRQGTTTAQRFYLLRFYIKLFGDYYFDQFRDKYNLSKNKVFSELSEAIMASLEFGRTNNFETEFTQSQLLIFQIIKQALTLELSDTERAQIYELVIWWLNLMASTDKMLSVLTIDNLKDVLQKLSLMIIELQKSEQKKLLIDFKEDIEDFNDENPEQIAHGQDYQTSEPIDKKKAEQIRPDGFEENDMPDIDD